MCLRLSGALQESVERTGSGIGGSLLSSRQGSPRTEHGILSTIPASEHFDNPLLTTCAPALCVPPYSPMRCKPGCSVSWGANGYC